MNKFHCLLVLFFVISATSSGQLSGIKNHKWQDKPAPTPVYEKFSNEDAYLVKERKSLSFTMDSKGIYVYTNIKRKIKILTQKGIDNYARIVLPKSARRKLSLVDARTIRKNGEIVDLDVKEIKEVEIADDDKIFDKKRYLLFSIPGVEAGDEVEFIAGYGGYGVDIGQDIYLHSYLASMHSEVIIQQVKSLVLDIRFYNNLAYPRQKESDTEITYQWESTDLPSLENQPGSVPTLDLPYISYCVKKIRWGGNYETQDVVGNAWTSALDWFAKYYVNVNLNENSKDGKLNDFFESIWSKNNATDVVSKIKSVHNYLNKNMKVIDLPDNESNMSPITYITNMKTDEANLYRIYHYLLNKVCPDLYLCMARDFYDGPIDFSFVAFQQINRLLFSFKDEAGNMHYITPRSDDETYELDEVAGEIQGTQYVAIRLRGSREVSNPKLPFNKPTDNIRSRLAKVVFLPGESTLEIGIDETLQGTYSTNHRHYYEVHNSAGTLLTQFSDLMKKRNDKAMVDSVKVVSFDDVFPFAYKLNYGFKLPGYVTKMDEKLFAVSIENWFYHQLEEINPVTRSMDYYFPNLGRDVFKYFLVFESDVQITNAEKLRKYISLPFCTYNLEITQVNSKTVLVESTFQVNKVHMPLSDTPRYSELYQKIEDADNEPLIIKFL